MRVEKQISQLEEEIQAIKSSFELQAASAQVETKTITFSTSANIIRWSNSSPYNPLQWETLVSLPKAQNGDCYGNEEILVTFNCASGSNTIASLEIKEISVNAGVVFLSARRIPYSGGARWIINLPPNTTLDGDTGYHIWSPSTIQIAVQSMIEGTLEAKMIWQ